MLPIWVYTMTSGGIWTEVFTDYYPMTIGALGHSRATDHSSTAFPVHRFVSLTHLVLLTVRSS